MLAEPVAVRPRPALRLRDLLAEAVAGILQRPGRTAMTAVGTMLGIGAFVAITGIADTAGGQVSSQFSVFADTQVTVTDSGGASTAAFDFPSDADARVDALAGVVAAGVYWPVNLGSFQVAAQPYGVSPSGASVNVYASSPGVFRAADARIANGAFFNYFHERRAEDVAVLGEAAASQLGISSITPETTIYIGGTAYSVLGIMSAIPRLPQLALSVIIPASTALRQYGLPDPSTPAEMLVQTKIGAAQLIARQAPFALLPRDPGAFSASAPPTLSQLQNRVTVTIDNLFFLLAGVALIVGALGIANTTLVAVLERTPEIGIRRTLGAMPRHIAAQVLTESAAIGAIGGLIGTSLAVTLIVAVAVVKHWTAVLDPAMVFPAPLAGAAVGLIAGIYPALRAAHIEPTEAMRG